MLQVSCSIQIGASTGGVDKSNFLCILGNNLFNQKYFLILWVWWVFLLVVAILGLIYRVARILVPDFSRLVSILLLSGHMGQEGVSYHNNKIPIDGIFFWMALMSTLSQKIQSQPITRFPSAPEMSLELCPRNFSRAWGNLLVQTNTSHLSAVYGYI